MITKSISENKAAQNILCGNIWQLIGLLFVGVFWRRNVWTGIAAKKNLKSIAPREFIPHLACKVRLCGSVMREALYRESVVQLIERDKLAAANFTAIINSLLASFKKPENVALDGDKLLLTLVLASLISCR